MQKFSVDYVLRETPAHVERGENDSRSIGSSDKFRATAVRRNVLNHQTRLWQRFQRTGDVTRQPVSGRPRVTTPLQDRYLVCFSDENTFEILQNKVQFVRRRRGEKFQSDCVVQILKHRTKIMIWSVFSGKGTGRLYMVKEVVRSVFFSVEENQSTDTIAKLKTKIENSSTFESDPDFVKTLIQNCINERVSRNEREATLEKQKIELAKLQLAQLEKEVELQTVKNKALSLNPAAKVEEKQFETNIENMIKSIKTLSLPVPTRSENFNLFFQSLERAFLTKKINDEYKSEILINLLGERAHNVLLYIKKEELNDYEKLKSIVFREFQLTPRECLNSFKNAVKSSGETYIQFAARLTANFQYYCSLRKVNSFESLCDLLISDKLFETLNKETATHIGIREAEDWFRPIDLAKECDIYISSRSGSRKETPIACGYTEDPFKNRPRNYKPKIRDNYPQNLERQNKNCYICGDSSHYARDCEKRFKPKESNGHIHNRKNANSLKVKSEKQKK
ncbi:integrase catalytic domain-containing protein [Trichonephila clavipes]|nr:integrase catalytic domain-containing protein [Trichonephila clavipes]